ncbi:MAG: NACHT domain-containing protein [Cyanobacteria bacterium J06621_3]
MALFENAIGGVAVSVLDQAIKAGKYAVDEIRGAYSKIQHEQRVIAASEAYIKNYLKWQCQIKIMPGLMKEPSDLEKIYTTVKLLDDESRRTFLGLEELEGAYRARAQRGLGAGSVERLGGMEIANSKQFLMVLGGPGIGKSTFLRKIGLETLKKEGQIQRECIPVFLELKKFREEQIDIKQKIVQEFDKYRFPSAEALVDASLEQGKLLILFDGLDEVPSQNLDYVIEQIEEFVDRYDSNSFVASCRTAAYHSSFRRFTDVTIAEFNDKQIEQFIDRWFSSAEDEALGIAGKYRDLLFQDNHKAAKELAKTPLLLTFLCLVYDREQTLPRKRSTLYERALNIILYEWSAQKRIKRDPIYKGFHPELEKLLLAKIAYDSFSKDQLFFSKDYVTEQITVFLLDTLDAKKALNADEVLEAIEVQQGILVERATGAYSFSHLTLQEYLAALHIVETQTERTQITKHLTDEHWREVFLLISGLMSNRSIYFFMVIDQQARAFIEPYAKLHKLVNKAAANKAGPSELSQRAAMLAIATASFRVSDRAVMSFRASTNSAISIAVARAVAIVSLSTNSASASASVIANDIASVSINSASASFRVISSARSISRGIASAITVASDLASTSTDGANDHHFLNAQVFESIAINLSNHQRSFPTDDASLEVWQAWISKFQLIWLKALELTTDDIDFSREEMKALQKYLYANELLIRCKEAAIRVSRSEWEALERRLLTMDDGTAE